MGSPIETWEGAAAFFTGAGGITPGLFLFLSIAFCIGAIAYGARHESESYERCELE